jgi:hypothetical protein
MISWKRENGICMYSISIDAYLIIPIILIISICGSDRRCQVTKRIGASGIDDADALPLFLRFRSGSTLFQVRCKADDFLTFFYRFSYVFLTFFLRFSTVSLTFLYRFSYDSLTLALRVVRKTVVNRQ